MATDCVALENEKRRLLVAQIPQLELAVQRTRDKNVLDFRVDRNVGDIALVALKGLRVLDLGLPEVVEPHEAVFVAREHELALVREVTVDTSRSLVVREHSRLGLLAF